MWIGVRKRGNKEGRADDLLSKTLTVEGKEVVQTFAPHSGRVWVGK